MRFYCFKFHFAANSFITNRNCSGSATASTGEGASVTAESHREEAIIDPVCTGCIQNANWGNRQ